MVRRLVTLVPSLALLVVGVEPTWALVLSRRSCWRRCALRLLPLVVLTARRRVMAPDVNHRVTTVLATLATAAIVVLNGVLVVLAVRGAAGARQGE
jgi:manganese transport protein